MKLKTVELPHGSDDSSLKDRIVVAAANLFNPGEHDSRRICAERMSRLRELLSLYYGQGGFFCNCPDEWHLGNGHDQPFSCKTCGAA